MKRLAVILILLLSIGVAYSQTQQKRITYSLTELLPAFDAPGQGQILITSDERFPDIMKGYINYLSSKPVRGWRVQIYFGTGPKARRKAQELSHKFKSQFPDIPVYILFEQPYFKVRVGNFISKQQASRFLFLIKRQYPKAFITEDKIDINHITQ